MALKGTPFPPHCSLLMWVRVKVGSASSYSVRDQLQQLVLGNPLVVFHCLCQGPPVPLQASGLSPLASLGGVGEYGHDVICLPRKGGTKD